MSPPTPQEHNPQRPAATDDLAELAEHQRERAVERSRTESRGRVVRLCDGRSVRVTADGQTDEITPQERVANDRRWVVTLALQGPRHYAPQRAIPAVRRTPAARPAARRPRARTTAASRDGPDDGSDNPEPGEARLDALSGPSPRFSRPWRPKTEAAFAELLRLDDPGERS